MNSLSYLTAAFSRRKGSSKTPETAQTPHKNSLSFQIQNITHEIVVTGETQTNTETETKSKTNTKTKTGTEDYNNDISDVKGEDMESLTDEETTLWKVGSVILFVPKVLIYLPIYYILRIVLYPFIQIYTLVVRIANWVFLTDADDVEFPNQSEYTDSEVNNESENDSTEAETSSFQISSSNISNRYLPKSTISTIAEESIEFDPDDHQDDDYFKSPLDTRPAIASLDLDESGNTDRSELIQLNAQSTPTKKNKKDILSNNINELQLQPINANNTHSNDTKNDKLNITPKQSNTPDFKTPVKPVVKQNKKKKKYIFPKLLFDFDILNPPNLPRKILVLDLDETLIHSLSRYNSSALNKSKGRSIEVKVAGNVPTLYHIYKRPYVEEFLSIVYQWFDLVCFTASIKEYADPVITYLEEQVLSNSSLRKTHEKQKFEIPNKIFKQRFYRNSCIFVEGKGYVKDLSVVLNEQNLSMKRQDSKNIQLNSTPTLKPRSRTSSISSNVSRSSSSNSKALDYSKILIIDNSPISYVRHKDNGLMVEGWINDPDDTELMNLLPVLNSLRFVSDVRCVLGLKDGQDVFK